MTSILGGLNLIVSHYCSELSLSGSRCVSRLGSIVSRCFSSLNPFSRREIGPVEGEQRLYTPIARPDYSIPIAARERIPPAPKSQADITFFME